MNDLDIDNLEFSAPTFDNKEATSHRRPKEKGNYLVDYCIRKMIGTNRGACINQQRAEDDPKGCALCIRFSNFKENKKE